jgi:hypothetical protein
MRESYPRIAKAPRDWRVAPTLIDYEAARAGFSWSEARRELRPPMTRAKREIPHYYLATWISSTS